MTIWNPQGLWSKRFETWNVCYWISFTLSIYLMGPSFKKTFVVSTRCIANVYQMDVAYNQANRKLVWTSFSIQTDVFKMCIIHLKRKEKYKKKVLSLACVCVCNWFRFGFQHNISKLGKGFWYILLDIKNESSYFNFWTRFPSFIVSNNNLLWFNSLWHWC